MDEMSFSRRAVLLLVICGFCQGTVATARKPQMTPAQDWMVIQQGDQLRLECQGEGEIQFSTLKTMLDVDGSNYTTFKNETSGAYIFVRPRTIREDTGWYACAEEGIKIWNDETILDHESNDIAWIYVYVNSTEPFAVEASFELLTAVAEGTLVVPCRTTSPDLASSVKAEINWGTTAVPENMQYDSKIGFILRNVSRQLSTTTFDCHVNGSDVLRVSYTLHISGPDELPKPTINQEQIRHVVWGGSMIVDCEATASNGQKFSMEWIVPKSIPSDRWSFSPADREEANGQSIWKTVLTVRNVEESDAGEYTCRVHNPLNASVAKAVIKVWDPNLNYINVTVNDRQVVAHERENAQWMIEIDTFPNFTLLWFKRNDEGKDEVIDLNKDGRYTLTREEPGKRLLKITNLNVNDNGIYVVELAAGTEVERINLELTVFAQPLVHIESVQPHYAPGKFATFTCHTKGHPVPNITWIVKEYSNLTSKEDVHLRYPSNTTSKEGPTGPYHLVSTVTVKINQSGDVTCRSCNDIKCVDSTETIFVSDVNGTFNIIDPGLVTQGDNISVTCGASVYNFTGQITWTSKIDPENKKSQGPRMSVTHRQTNFTSQSILEIREVAKSDGGEYVCEAIGTDGTKENKTFVLKVQDIQKPYFKHTDMNNTEISIDLTKNKGKPEKLFYCFAEGRPIPRVIWYKDDKPIVNNTQFELLNGNATLKVKYFSDPDSGRYLCRATNRVGSAESYIDIKILGKSQSIMIWITLICVLIAIIIIVITYMGIKVHRERKLRKALCDAGLTHFVDGALECLNPELTVDDQAELLPYDKKWEFPRENLKIGKQLGSGAFGVVVKAEARGICVEGEVTTVAVKMVRRTAEPSYMKALSSELKIMIHLGKHLNVVNLLGACTKTILTKRELYVIVEYCRFGNLHNYLQRHRSSFVDQIDPVTQKIDSNIGVERLVRSASVGSQNRLQYAALSFSRSISIRSSDSNSGNELVDYRQGTDFVDINMSPDGGVLSNNSVQPGWRSNYRGDYKDQNLKPICTQDLLCWAWQVSRGMEYLSSRNVLHGDLAARNILLADDNIVKICDFGLAKNMYKDNNYKKKGDGPLPIKWMAVESIRDRIFSTHSDVWSFGIVLWEFFTLARTPYPGMEAEKQYDRLIEGYRMEKPEYATDEIYELMTYCWKAKPSLRPSFPELAEKIGTLLTDSIITHYMDLNTPYMEMNSTAMENGQSDYLTMMSSPNHDYDNAPEPTSPGRPDSTYLSMNPVPDTCDSGIFSPRVQLEESHFNFPPSAKNISINSDSEDCIDSEPMPSPEDPYIKPIDVKQRRAEFVKQNKEQTPIERDSGYCNIPNSPDSHYSNLQSQLSEMRRNLDETQNTDKPQKVNNKDISPAIISGKDNYINLPKQKSDRSNTTVDSFSNPSYVIMSKLEDGRQLV